MVKEMIDTKVISLLKVDETKNFTRAAEQLNLTQPAVSQHIRILEEELGVKLFNRTPNELKITKEGKIVCKYAKRMLALAKNLDDDLKNERELIKSLSVGITHTAESNASAEALANYANEHENVKIKIITDTQENLCNKLKNYEIDLAIVEGRVSNPSLKTVMLDTDSLVLALAPNHPLARRNSIRLDELKKEKMIIRSRTSSTRGLFQSSIESKNIHIEEFNIIMEIDNIQTIKDLVRRGFGVSVLARSACLDEYYKNKIALLPIEGLSMIREINLAYQADFDHDDVIKEIVASYNETLKNTKVNI